MSADRFRHTPHRQNKHWNQIWNTTYCQPQPPMYIRSRPLIWSARKTVGLILDRVKWDISSTGLEALSQDSNNTWILSSWILHYFFFLLFMNACVIRSSLTCRTSASAAKQHLFHLIYFYYNIDNCDYTTCQSRINQNSRRQNISLQSAKCNFCARHKPQTLQSYRPHSFDSVSDDDFFPFLLKWQKCRLTGSDRVLFLGSQLDDASAFRGTYREIRFVWE